ncbi:MAG: hypothetical protein IH968_15685 [Gemmatimonadetes bacterium]|nr:hypothetical protein [Gemmatimonadota bacterium]
MKLETLITVARFDADDCAMPAQLGLADHSFAGREIVDARDVFPKFASQIPSAGSLPSILPKGDAQLLLFFLGSQVPIRKAPARLSRARLLISHPHSEI